MLSTPVKCLPLPHFWRTSEQTSQEEHRTCSSATRLLLSGSFLHDRTRGTRSPALGEGRPGLDQGTQGVPTSAAKEEDVVGGWSYSGSNPCVFGLPWKNRGVYSMQAFLNATSYRSFKKAQIWGALAGTSADMGQRASKGAKACLHTGLGANFGLLSRSILIINDSY